MTDFDVVGEDDFCILGDFKRPSKAAERREGRRAIREDLEDLEDFYPEIAHVRYVARF